MSITFKDGTVKNLPRFHVDATLSSSGAAPLRPEQAHHLTVLRLNPGDSIRVFNGKDGEYRATICGSKNRPVAQILEQLRPSEPLRPLTLAFAPLKKERLFYLIEKATELGVTHFVPLKTTYSQHKFTEEKALLQAIQAVQQSERLHVPTFGKSTDIKNFIESAQDPVLWGACRSDAPPLCQVLKTILPTQILVGPEGGFSEEEHQLLMASPLFHAYTLGDPILRAETAALVSLSILQHLQDF